MTHAYLLFGHSVGKVLSYRLCLYTPIVIVSNARQYLTSNATVEVVPYFLRSSHYSRNYCKRLARNMTSNRFYSRNPTKVSALTFK